jgi:hypothetical protein
MSGQEGVIRFVSDLLSAGRAPERERGGRAGSSEMIYRAHFIIIDRSFKNEIYTFDTL